MEALRIYLADDDYDDRKFVGDALQNLPVENELMYFENGVDLMNELFSNRLLPDIIFLDLYMPIMDGFECLVDIRSFERFAQIELIVYSSTHLNREINQLIQEGANQFLPKPESQVELQKILRESLVSFADGRLDMRKGFKILGEV